MDLWVKCLKVALPSNSTWQVMCLGLNAALLGEACLHVLMCFQKRKSSLSLWSTIVYNEWCTLKSTSRVTCNVKYSSVCPSSLKQPTVVHSMVFLSSQFGMEESSVWLSSVAAITWRHMQDFFNYLRLPQLCHVTSYAKKKNLLLLSKQYGEVASQLSLGAEAV